MMKKDKPIMVAAAGQAFEVVDEAAFLDGFDVEMARQAAASTEQHADVLRLTLVGGILTSTNPGETAREINALDRGAQMLRQYAAKASSEEGSDVIGGEPRRPHPRGGRDEDVTATTSREVPE